MEAVRPGTRLGHYLVGDRIGEGGMGVVFRGRDERLGRDVALKILTPDALGNADSFDRFTRESRTASSLNHPNIVTIYDVGESNEVRFIVEELVAGETLRQRLSHDSLSLREALEIGIQVAGALAATHAAGVVHRD